MQEPAAAVPGVYAAVGRGGDDVELAVAGEIADRGGRDDRLTRERDGVRAPGGRAGEPAVDAPRRDGPARELAPRLRVDRVHVAVRVAEDEVEAPASGEVRELWLGLLAEAEREREAGLPA